MSSKTEMHITIGAYPIGKMNLQHDVNLVKAAVLYADKARLCSVQSSFLLSQLQIGELPPEQQLDVLVAIASESKESDVAFEVEQLQRTVRAIKREKHKNREDLILIAKFQKLVDALNKDLAEFVSELAESSRATELSLVKDKGLLQIHPLDEGGDIAQSFSKALWTAVTDHSTYPLFDQDTGSLVRLAIQEGHFDVPDDAVLRSKNVNLAEDLFGRLPLFEAASVKEILDIREELKLPLRKFRGAMMAYSDAIRSAAWDQDFESEAERVFRRSIDPAIAEIEEHVRNNRYLYELIEHGIEQLGPLGAGGFGTFMSKVSAIPEIVGALVQAGGTVAAGIGLGTTLYKSIRSWRKKMSVRNRINYISTIA